MIDNHGSPRRRVSWAYDDSPIPMVVADALITAARYVIADGWSPQRLLVNAHASGFHVHLDLAQEDTDE
jgi:hypothetical protein